MRMTHLALLSTLALASQITASLSGEASRPIPALIDAYAVKLESGCPSASAPSGAASQRSPKLIQFIGARAGGTIYVVDGSFTACGNAYPLCGTGGCQIGVFLVRGDIVETMYMDEALQWTVSSNGRKMLLTVHGSVCGGFGPDACAIDIDLASGKKRTLVPKK
jgi:hypothetical protein